jgi:hypothetical protein
MGVSIRFCLAVILALGSQPALAEALHTFTIAKWTGGAYASNETGQFNHCAASSTYLSGITMIFAINRQYEWNIGFTHPSWTLTNGTSIDVIFTIDNSAPLTGKAIALGATHVAVRLADSAALFQRFRRGRQLNVFAVGKLFQFNLTDTAQVLPVLLKCVVYQGQPFQIDGPAGPPTAAAARPRPGGDAASSAAARAEATALAANILGQTGMKFQILTPGETKIRADAVWKAGPILGAIYVLQPDGVTKLEDIPGRIIGEDARACRGKFLSGSLPDVSDGPPIARMFTICDTLKSTITIYYLGVARSAGGFYLIGTMSTGPDKSDNSQEPFKEADSNIRSAVFKVLPK